MHGNNVQVREKKLHRTRQSLTQTEINAIHVSLSLPVSVKI